MWVCRMIVRWRRQPLCTALLRRVGQHIMPFCAMFEVLYTLIFIFAWAVPVSSWGRADWLVPAMVSAQGRSAQRAQRV
jgi:hypothetical protein